MQCSCVHRGFATEDYAKRVDLDDVVACYQLAHRRHLREETERFHKFAYEELAARDKLNLDIFWLKDNGHVDPDSLPPPDEVTTEIVENLELALENSGMSRWIWLKRQTTAVLLSQRRF